MANILATGVYLADRPNTAAHLMRELAGSRTHHVVQRWIALAPGGSGRCDLPSTEMVVTEPTPKFILLDQLIRDAGEFDWLLLCDDDVEVGDGFLDLLIGLSERYDFALSQPARSVDSFTDHPIVQVLPGLLARRTRFVEIGPLTCVRRDALPHLLPFGNVSGMGWGMDFVWPARLESAGLRMGIVDAAVLAHRIRPPVTGYSRDTAEREMHLTLARNRHLSLDEAFTVLEAYA